MNLTTQSTLTITEVAIDGSDGGPQLYSAGGRARAFRVEGKRIEGIVTAQLSVGRDDKSGALEPSVILEMGAALTEPGTYRDEDHVRVTYERTQELEALYPNLEASHAGYVPEPVTVNGRSYSNAGIVRVEESRWIDGVSTAFSTYGATPTPAARDRFDELGKLVYAEMVTDVAVREQELENAKRSAMYAHSDLADVQKKADAADLRVLQAAEAILAAK